MESKAAQLRRRYPTKTKLDIAIKSAGSKKLLGVVLGVTRQNINELVRWHNNGGLLDRVSPQRSNCLKTNEEMEETIKELFGGGKTEVKVYLLTEDYVPGSCNYEGLVYLRSESGVADISPWTRKKEVTQ